MWLTRGRMPLKKICALVPSLNYIIEWFIFHEPHNLISGLPFTLIFHSFFSCPFFFSLLSVSSISPPAMPVQTHRRAHTPLILLTPMALRKEVQYVHWRQNIVITILQNDNHRQPKGFQGLFYFVLPVGFSAFLWSLKAEVAVVCSIWEVLVSWYSKKNCYGTPVVRNGQSRGLFRVPSHRLQQSTISHLQPVTQLHFMFVIVSTRKKVPFLVISLSFLYHLRHLENAGDTYCLGCHLTPLLLI